MVTVTSSLEYSVSTSGLVFRRASGRAPTFPLSTTPLSEVRRLGKLEPWLVLERLWGDGAIERSGDGDYLLPFDRLVGLAAEDRHELGVPAPIEARVRVNTKGTPGREPFGITVQVDHPKLGALEGVAERLGPAYWVANRSTGPCGP